MLARDGKAGPPLSSVFRRPCSARLWAECWVSCPLFSQPGMHRWRSGRDGRNGHLPSSHEAFWSRRGCCNCWLRRDLGGKNRVWRGKIGKEGNETGWWEMNSEGKALGSLVAHALALGRQGSCVGPFAVNGPFTRMSGRRKRMIFLLTTINKGIRTKSLQGFYAPASHLMPTKSS